MHSPPDEDTQVRMQAAHDTTARKLGLSCTGEPAWGFLGCTIGRRAGERWLRVSSVPLGSGGRKPGEGIVGASTLIPDDVPRPRLHEVMDWSDGRYEYRSELLDYVAEPVVSARPDLTHDPALPDEWWGDLHRALAQTAQGEGARATVRDSWIARAFPQFLGVPAPSVVERVTGHGDLHWGNLTGSPLVILDWERWGHVPVGFDAGLLHANSLLLPGVAERVRTEFAPVLESPAGRIGELAALAEMLQAVARGWYRELAPLLAQRAAELTGVKPPLPVSSEFAT